MWMPVLGSPGSAAPCSRAKHSATLLAGYLYVLGGRSSGNVPLKDFWRYSLAEGRWEQLESRGQSPPALQEHSALAHGSQLYVFGGELGYSSTETPLWVYDTQKLWWRKLSGSGSTGPGIRSRGVRGAGAAPRTPRGRRGHSAHVLGEVMLIYGGYQDLKGSSNELWAFHFESESWHLVEAASGRGGCAAPARHRHAAALHDRRLYVHAGMQDLRECADLWNYDTVSRSWSQIRCKISPGALHGHVAVRVPGYLYVFGGESGTMLNNDLWKFHFATGTWERVAGHGSWPAPRADACALLITELPLRTPVSRPARAHQSAMRLPMQTEPPSGFLREISKLSQFNLRRSNSRCSYTVLSGEKDSTESLSRPHRVPSPPLHHMVKSHSSYMIDKRRPLSCGGAIRSGEPREADVAETRLIDVTPRVALVPDVRRIDICRDPISVPTPVLSPVEATKLVYLDSEEEEEMRREDEFEFSPPVRLETAVQENLEPVVRRIEDEFSPPVRLETAVQENLEPVVRRIEVRENTKKCCEAIPKSASVRFRSHPDTEDESELSTSDYASAERVNRLSSTSTYSTGAPGVGGETTFGFCNPHYLGPDVQDILGGAVALNTPDSGVGESSPLPGEGEGGVEVELVDMGRSRRRTRKEEPELSTVAILLVGGKETPHGALMHRPIAMWTYTL